MSRFVASSGASRLSAAAAFVLAAGCGASTPPEPAAAANADMPPAVVGPSARPAASSSDLAVPPQPSAAGSTLETSPPSATPSAGSPALPPPAALMTSTPPSALHVKLEEVARELEGKRDAQARAKLTPLMPQAERGAIDERLAAHALSGRLHARANAIAAAESEFRLVRDLWAAPGTATSIGGAGESEDVKMGRVARALDAVGAALFFLADQSRKQNVDTLKFPAFKAAASRAPSKRLQDMSQPEVEQEMERRRKENETIKRFIDTDVKQWVDRKRAAIEATDRAYKTVVELQPVPPPRWVVASAARVGQMWDGFVADFQRAPLPGWMASEPELIETFKSTLEGASEPIRARARAAFSLCQSFAARFQIRDAYASTCDVWMTAHPAAKP